MIAYFSGTGNSRLVALMLQELTGDRLVSIPDMVNKGERTLESNGPVVIVSPIYAWKVPRYVEEFIESTEFRGSSMVYFVMTCAGDAGFNSKYVENICRRKGLEFMGEVDLTMPDNYIIMGNPPSREDSARMIRDVIPTVRDVARHITDGERIVHHPKSGMFKTYVMNPMFYKFYIDCDGFSATRECDGCGKCVADCPVRCITVTDGKPRWSGKCIQCLSCINRCPRKAIEFKSKTKGKERYVCPFDDPSELLR